MDEFDKAEVLAFTSPEFADVRVDHDVARGEFAARAINRQTAEMWGSIADVVAEAVRHPELFIRPDTRLSRSERVDYSVRSAVADFAIRLAVAENTARGWGEAAATLRSYAPRVWADFAEGAISVSNARVIADSLMLLPEGDRPAFEAVVMHAAAKLPPARFRAFARSARERVHHEEFAARHKRATELRRVALEDDVDGMSWLSIHLSTVHAHQAFAAIDATARSLQRDDEPRTLDQLRADVAGDFLTGSATGPSVGVSV